MNYGRCQVCNEAISKGGCIDPDTNVRVCQEHWDILDSKGMMDARFTLARSRNQILVLDLQGTQVFAIEKDDLDIYYSVMSDIDLYEQVYKQYSDVLVDLGLIEMSM